MKLLADAVSHCRSPVLIFSHELTLTGAPIVLVHLARTLRQMGWDPVIGSYVEGPLRAAFENEGFPVVVLPRETVPEAVLETRESLAFVIASTLVTAEIVTTLNHSTTPVLWWIHEAAVCYSPNLLDKLPGELAPNVQVYCGGGYARHTLARFVPRYEARVLFPLVEMKEGPETDAAPRPPDAGRRLRFACVGSFEPRKGQDVIAAAIRRLTASERARAEFLFLGRPYDAEVLEVLRDAERDFPGTVRVLREIPLVELPGFYRNIDVLICASRDDPMPLVVQEALKLGKVVVCSENTGWYFIDALRSSFLWCPAGDSAALTDCIRQVLGSSPDQLASRGRGGQTICRTLFSKERFDRDVEKALACIRQGARLVVPTREAGVARERELLECLFREQRKGDEARSQLGALISENECQKAEVRRQADQIQRLAAESRRLQEIARQYDIMRASTCWRMTEPIRSVLDEFRSAGTVKGLGELFKQFVPYGIIRIWLLKRYAVKIDESLGYYPGLRQRLVRLVKFALPHGVSMALRKPYTGLCPSGTNGAPRFRRLSDVNVIDAARHKLESAFRSAHTVSILVPLYNTQPRLLREMIDSVRAQTCGNWELCLGDASDTRHKATSRIAKKASRDKRIKYLQLAKNGGISANTNAVLPIATGDVIALLDHDDLLHPSAVYKVLRALESDDVDFVYTDELTFADEGDRRIVVKNFKPDYSPDYLRSVNYICHFSAFRRSLLEKAGGGLFDSAYDGSQDHDLFLRLAGVARRVAHIPELLYFWRAHAGSTAKDAHAKEYVTLAGCRAVAADLERRGWKGAVEAPYGPYPSFYRIRYEINPAEKVSIVIPTRNHVADLRKCLASVFAKSTHRNYEIVILDNGSTEQELKAYYRELEADRRVKVVFHDVPFNFSEINNFAVRNGATGKYLLFLNNDTEVIEPGWIEEMQMYAQRPDVGCVGAKLFYPDDTIQHGGVILGTGGIAGHAFLNAAKDDPGRSGRLISVMNYSIVTAACLMVRREVFDEVGGFWEGLAVAFNDVDFCMKVRKAGYLNVWTPHATLYHYESKSRGAEDTPEKQRRFLREMNAFKSRWQAELDAGDPYYNVNLRLDASAFERER